MDFAQTKEQQAIVKSIAEFCRKELLPESANIDRTTLFPTELYKKMADVGINSVTVPEEYGGQGLDYLTVGYVFEEIGKCDINCSTIQCIQVLAAEVLKIAGNKEQQDEWFPKMVNGDTVLGLALTEPQAGTDAAALSTKAIKDGDYYILNGEKSGISLVAETEAMIIFAKTDPASGAGGVSAIMVPMDLPGVKVQTYEDSGCRAVKRGSIFLDNVKVPAEKLIGKEGDGFRKIMAGMDFTRVLLGISAIGGAQASIDETIKHVKERIAFGRPIGKFEGISFALAEHQSKLDAVRLLSHRALWLRDQSLPHTKEAAMSKLLAPKVSVDIIHSCLLLHGHYGYTNELLFEQRLRDAMGMEIADGTAQVCQIVLAREMLGREYLPY